MNLVAISYMEDLIEQVKNIDTENLSDVINLSDDKISTVIEEQKTYFWIRVYLKDENSNLEIGDDITIEWLPDNEKLKTKFVCFSKKGLGKDSADNIINYNTEDDKKVLCLMIDENQVNYNNDIPFIRTLFKTGRHYEYQLIRRSELILVNDRNNITLDYFDIDF